MKTALTTLFTLLLALTFQAAAAAPQPNIVHILTDDLGWQDLACYYRALHGKDSIYETPNLDRLAREGRRFMQAYSPAPTCSPSRAAYMAGQWTTHTGVVHVMGGLPPRAYNEGFAAINPFYPARLDMTTPTIARVLKNAGYQTAHIAKWHLGGRSNGYPAPVDYGFDLGWFGNVRGTPYNDPELWDMNDKKTADFNGLWAVMKPNRITGFPDSHQPTERYALDEDDDDRPFDSVVNLVVRWMDKTKDQGQPMFVNFCPFFVHGPISARDRKRLEHYCQKMGLPFPTDPGRISDKTQGQVNPYYAAMIDALDWQVGKVIKFLETTDDPRNPGHKLIDNTYIIFSSDNGGCTGLPITDGKDKGKSEAVADNSPLRGGKQTVFEGGIRIPFIVRGPGVPADSVCDTPVSLIDLFPTFMALAGGARPVGLDLDGCNILPLFHGADQPARFADGRARDTLYWHYPIVIPASSIIRKGGWKLILNHAPEQNNMPPVQLFQLYNEDGGVSDLGETKDLAEANPSKRDELLADLKSWLARYDAPMPYKNAGKTSKPLPHADQVPAILKRGSTGDRVQVEFETGPGKAKVVEARFIYTANGSDLLREGSGAEEWFEAPAILRDGVATATAAPGMTHGIFCLRDENNFLITSEPLGVEVRGESAAKGVKDGYAYRPGLVALIRCADSAARNAKVAGLNAGALAKEMEAARKVVAQPVEEASYAAAIRNLRRAIRALSVPEARLPELNQFQSTKW